MSSEHLQGKVYVITGAAGRLGQRVVRHFAEAGAIIAAVIAAEDQAQDIPFPENAEGWAFPADLTDEATVKAVFAQIAQQFDRVDGLIHTVGTWGARSLLETSLDDWRSMLDVNLTSTFLCFREAAALMKDQGGRLIALASRQGADGAPAQQAAYAAAKAGIVRLVEAAGAEFGDAGLTAHAIAPSTLRFEDEGEGVSADAVVALCDYLASDAGAAHNGATLRIYG